MGKAAARRGGQDARWASEAVAQYSIFFLASALRSEGHHDSSHGARAGEEPRVFATESRYGKRHTFPYRVLHPWLQVRAFGSRNRRYSGRAAPRTRRRRAEVRDAHAEGQLQLPGPHEPAAPPRRDPEAQLALARKGPRREAQPPGDARGRGGVVQRLGGSVRDVDAQAEQLRGGAGVERGVDGV
jgi:hypothetical protein